MNIFSRIFGDRRQSGGPKPPEPPSLPKFHQQFQVKDGQLEFSARTLDEFYTRAEASQGAQRLLEAMSYAEQLKGDDQTSLDSDARPGHVSLAEENFESHPDGYAHQNGRVHVAGDAAAAWTTQVDDDYAFKQQQGRWDKENQTFDYHYQMEPLPDWGSGGKSVVAQGDFAISKEGKVANPDSTPDSHEARIQALMADRAGALIEAAAFWSAQGISLDQTPQDFHPEREGVVAPNVERQSLEQNGLGSERALSQAYNLTDGKATPYKTFDIEATPDKFIVAANDLHHSRPYGAKMAGVKSPEGLSVILERPEEGSVEKASWNFSSGRVKYERLEKG